MGSSSVSVLGLGPMGAALAEAYLAAGRPLTVWNRTAAKAEPFAARGAALAATPAEAAAADLLVVCLNDFAAVSSVLDAAGPALAGRTVVNLTSSTPDEARAAVDLAAAHGARYLDGAIMVPPPAIGSPEAVFFYSGDRELFDAHGDALRELGGDARFLGEDPGLAVLYNTSLLGLMWATVNGYLHATAMVNTAGATSAEFAPIALDWFLPSVVAPILRAATGELDGREYPGGAGTVEMNRTAAEHLLETSAAAGVGTDVPRFLVEMLEKTARAGHGGSGYMAMVELFRGRAGGAGRG
ncbi:NAD(P)-dependent oxidoreductase [Actinokineospora sp. G85]|uniref:NAD(P)-dependent oxidoreductase n=1 Tax=Actinokineospora sp. G85 TaxID=3406626 RepID=UPI003C772AC4